MQRVLCLFIAFGALIAAAPAVAEKSGGVLKVQHWDSPASMSILEEATYSTVVPVMEVMNNLVIYDQHIAQNSLNTIRPDLAESWSWREDGTELTFKLRSGANGMTASRSLPRTSNALSIYCKARQRTSCGSILARAGGTTSTTSAPTAIFRPPSI